MATTTTDDDEQLNSRGPTARLLSKRNSSFADDNYEENDAGWPGKSFCRQVLYSTDDDFSAVEPPDLRRLMTKQQSSESFSSDYAAAYDDLDLFDAGPGMNRERLPTGWSFRILRWPLLFFIGSILFIELLIYFAVRQYVNVVEFYVYWRGKKRELRQQLHLARDYQEWKKIAAKLDRFLQLDSWKQQDKSPFYDYRLIRRVSSLLEQYRLAAVDSQSRESYVQLMNYMLDGALKPNLGGVENISLYSRTYLGTKTSIEQYVDRVVHCLDVINEAQCLNVEEKYKFFKRASKMYGRSALCLSGGATFGYYHLGVCRALLDGEMLPSVVNGTSSGSLVAAFICVRTEEELRQDLNPEMYKVLTACDRSLTEMIRSLYKTGAMFDDEHWRAKVEWLFHGNTTFKEAYERSGRVLNITVVSDREHSPPKLLNYKTAPDIVIYSAVFASSAIPGVLPPIQLKRKTFDGQVVPYLEEGLLWRDGSLRIDIPIRELHQMFRVNFTVVSQVNPHIIPFFFDNKGSVGRPPAYRYGRGWRGGFIATWLEHSIKLDLRKWLTILRDLDLVPLIMSQNWSNVWLQTFHGSVTIIPKPAPSDYFRILTDPTRERMERYLRLGAVRTWPKMHMINNRLKIERRLFQFREKLHKDK